MKKDNLTMYFHKGNPVLVGSYYYVFELGSGNRNTTKRKFEGSKIDEDYIKFNNFFISRDEAIKETLKRIVISL